MQPDLGKELGVGNHTRARDPQWTFSLLLLSVADCFVHHTVHRVEACHTIAPVAISLFKRSVQTASGILVLISIPRERTFIWVKSHQLLLWV